MDFKSKTTQKILNKLNKNKENKTMKTINWETVKTVIIAVLITGIIAFIAGMVYKDTLNAQVEAKAQTIVKNVQVEVQPLKK